MVRARLSTINGQFIKDNFLRFNKGQRYGTDVEANCNLSYLFDQPVDNIIEGSPLLGRYDPLEDKPVQISLKKMG